MDYFKIVTDSMADLPKDYLDKHQIGCMNLSYIIDDVVYGQGKELELKEFFDAMRKGKMPTTSQVNPDEAKACFEEYYKTNKKILYLAGSSGISGTYNSGRIAAEEMMYEHPDCEIVVIDTLSASLGEGLLVYKAVMLREQGKSMEETAQWVQENIQKTVHIITVDDLNHLYRGGRVSRTSALVGTLVSVKPLIHINQEGRLVVLGKTRGRKKSLDSLVEYMNEKNALRGKDDIVFIMHGDCISDAEYVKEQVNARYGIENFMISYAGPIIGTHVGPGTVAIFFLGDSR
ncbi:MAG: DegV family protein [Lachnospiraceae bacterium]|nr:DegV family protein [Lachnospiraceae bacterium]